MENPAYTEQHVPRLAYEEDPEEDPEDDISGRDPPTIGEGFDFRVRLLLDKDLFTRLLKLGIV